MRVARWSKVRITTQHHVRATRLRDDLWLNQCGEFFGVTISVRTILEGVSRTRMQIDLCRTGREMAKESIEPRSRHRAGPGKAKNAIWRTQSGPPYAAGKQPCPGRNVSKTWLDA